jgi:hypothetical protein
MLFRSHTSALTGWTRTVEPWYPCRRPDRFRWRTYELMKDKKHRRTARCQASSAKNSWCRSGRLWWEYTDDWLLTYGENFCLRGVTWKHRRRSSCKLPIDLCTLFLLSISFFYCNLRGLRCVMLCARTSSLALLNIAIRFSSYSPELKGVLCEQWSWK